MSSVLDETSADVPVREFSVNVSRPADSSLQQNARARQDVSRVSREELEDRFLRLHEETLLLKQQIHNQDDKIRKLGTKLMRLRKDRSRMEQLAAGGAPMSRGRDVEMEEMMEELQEKVRTLQAENEGLKQRLLLSKQQLLHQSRRTTPYTHVQPRVNSRMKRLQDDTSKSTRSLEAGRPPTGQLPRYGHSLLEDARAEIRNLENVVESQRVHMEEMETASELLRQEVKKKEEEYEEKLLQLRQQQTSKLRSHVSSNVTMIKLQQQLSERSNTVTELQGRFLQIQESQRTMKVSHDAAMMKVDELSAQLKDERMKSLELEKHLQNNAIATRTLQQMQERISDLQQERDLLKDNNDKLVNSALDVSQQQKWSVQEQQLKLQIAQLETALQADLLDKNQILDKIKAERDTNEKLMEENQKLHVQFVEQKQQLEELTERLKTHSRETEHDVDELTEALMLIKGRRCDLGFLKDEAASGTENAVRDLRAAHAETIQELEKTRSLLSMESRISQDYKAELQAVLQKTDGDRRQFEEKLQHQAELLDARAAKIRKLEARLRDVAYGNRALVFQPDAGDEDDEDELDGRVDLQRGENVVELQIVGASLSASALVALGDEPSTFCTYSFYRSELHATPVAPGRSPRYGFTSCYVVNMDEHFLHFLQGGRVSLELHQALGLDWNTLASAQLPLTPLIHQEGKVHGTAPLVTGVGEEQCSFGSVDYWMRLRRPMTETMRLYRDKMKAAGFISQNQNPQLQPNQLYINVQRCKDLQPGGVRQLSPYVVYKFFDFPDYPTATVHACRHPEFNDLKSYSVHMDEDLDRYLKSETLQFYVFDYEEEQMDVYVGKARVPLLPLTQDQAISGMFELTDPSGLPAGHLEVTLRWRSAYVPPAGSIRSEEEKQDKDERLHQSVCDAAASHHAPLPKLRQRTHLKEAAAKRVTFIETPAADQQPESAASAASAAAGVAAAGVAAAGVAAAGVAAEEEEDEESHFSEGQLVAASAPSYSDDSDVSEEIIEDVDEDQRESTQSDSDDCIVHGGTESRRASERLRLEVVSLSLSPDSRVSRDASVVRLFVEYSFLDLPTEETPLSLPKPPPGKTINYNYSKVVPVDAETQGARRRLLRDVLLGRNPTMERIRFTVVSEPSEEEEQEKECEDVGVAFLKIPEILETQRDLLETSLTIVDVEDSSQLVGSLVVSLEGLESLQRIMEEAEPQQTAVAIPLTSA